MSGAIFQLLEDHNGAIWVSTQNGLTRIDVQINKSPGGLSLDFKDYPVKDYHQSIKGKDALYSITSQIFVFCAKEFLTQIN
ncbi:hypothetical protein H8E88_19455 [candidate division KSB1 bacterium]|nr:hypothetical protein [candidate division KSB1 bacterium]